MTTSPTQGEHAQTELAHELFAAAQLAPGEGIEDAVSRIAAALTATTAQPAAPQGVAYAELPDVDALAQEIRRVDGSHNLGAGALAEALMPFLRASNGQAPAGAVPLTPGQIAEIADEAHRRYSQLVSSGQCQPRWSAVFAHLLEKHHGIKGDDHA